MAKRPKYEPRISFMSKRLIIILPFLLTACLGRIPEPVDYPFSQQQKMQAAYHWQVLADDVANRVNHELILNDYLKAAVFVRESCGNEDNPCKPNVTSSFDEAFRDLLITRLVKLGVPVLVNAQEAGITVHYKVQLVYHRTTRVPTMKPGLLTTHATLITVLRNIPHELRTIAAVASLDITNQNLVANGHYEVIITTSIAKNGNYFYRGSDLYYINDKDSYHYQATTP
jgi:hypothetical protein